MNVTTNVNETVATLSLSLLYQKFHDQFLSGQNQSSTPQRVRLPQPKQQHKPLNYLQIIEICSLCLILVEHTIVFILTFRKKSPKRFLFDTK
jgi:hypothetical protein